LLLEYYNNHKNDYNTLDKKLDIISNKLDNLIAEVKKNNGNDNNFNNNDYQITEDIKVCINMII